jgi:hypothetical protein
MIEEGQLPSIVNGPLGLEDSQPIDEQAGPSPEGTHARKSLVPRIPAPPERTEPILSIGRYRPSPPKGRAREQTQSPVYSQIGKRPAPRPAFMHRWSDKSTRKA